MPRQFSEKKIQYNIPRSDRGLLPPDKEQREFKRKLYNNSHADVSPAHYNSTMDVVQKSCLRNTNKLAK